MLKLKASSLTNTIFICLLIAILSGSLVLIAHYNKLFQTKIELENKLLVRNNNSLNYGLSKINNFDFNLFTDIEFINDEINSKIKKKKWGFYEVVTCMSIFKSDTICKTILLGQKQISNRLALYTTNYDNPLKFTGSVSVSGNINVPNGKTDEVYLNGSNSNKINIRGLQKTSNKKLPVLELKQNTSLNNYKTISLEEIGREFVNPFSKETIIIDVSGLDLIKNIDLKGNIILMSESKISIENTATLNDILIKSPKVSIESGFQGNIQIEAKSEVVLEENVMLKYPSSIYVSNDDGPIHVEVKDNSIVSGGIVINGKSYLGSSKRELIISEKAKIIGVIYNYGKTQLQGELIGTIYSDRFFLKTQSSVYENVIKNAVINRDSLPKNFINLPLFNSSTSSYDIIKEL